MLSVVVTADERANKTNDGSWRLPRSEVGVLLFAAKELSFAANRSGGRTQSLARESNFLAADTKTWATCMRENY